MRNKYIDTIQTSPLLTLIGVPGMLIAIIATKMDDGILKNVIMTVSIILILLASISLGLILMKLKKK